GAAPGTSIADIANKSVFLSGIQGKFLLAQLSGDGCPVLRADASVTLDGRPIDFTPGRHNVTPVPGMASCYPPVAQADLTGETATTLVLAFSDPTQTVEVRIAGYHPFGFAPGDLASLKLRPGDTVTVAVPQAPEVPDRFGASFYAAHGPPSMP